MQLFYNVAHGVARESELREVCCCLCREYSLAKSKIDADGGTKRKGQATRFDFFQEHF